MFYSIEATRFGIDAATGELRYSQSISFGINRSIYSNNYVPWIPNTNRVRTGMFMTNGVHFLGYSCCIPASGAASR